MKDENYLRKQMENVRQETESSAVLNDVIDSELEQHPGQNEEITKTSQITPEQEIVRDNVDGKTWLDTD
ncbi:hypothetical protein [Sediminibacillus massiliensis]|uniref:hypothetical protein n=1 Tax=Sediminibacillus massiliensis TaxID=1926277 RepID=UPI0009888800|nr:hypothetical protein [Sediminibacillus massiliensis]